MKDVCYCRLPFLASLVVVMTSCAQSRPEPLYSWETFPKQQYSALLGDGGSVAEQIQTLEKHTDRARASNAALPPGFRAHLGMLHLSEGRADQARQLWLSEKAAFPESTPYIDQLIKKLEATTPASAQRVPL